MIGNGSKSGDDSPRQTGQVLEHENGIFKDWKSYSRNLCVSIFKAPLSIEGREGWTLNTLCPPVFQLNSRYFLPAVWLQ